MVLRRVLIVLGVVLVSCGVLGAAWAVALELDAIIGYGLMLAILGMQCVTLGYAVKIAASDWPPTILVATGISIGERRERRRQQRDRMGIVHDMGQQIGGQS